MTADGGLFVCVFVCVFSSFRVVVVVVVWLLWCCCVVVVVVVVLLLLCCVVLCVWLLLCGCCVSFFLFFMKAILSFSDFWTFFVVFSFSLHLCFDLPQVPNCYESDSFIV